MKAYAITEQEADAMKQSIKPRSSFSRKNLLKNLNEIDIIIKDDELLSFGTNMMRGYLADIMN